MVWYGMVWPGMVWHGMAWHGMAWYGMVWYGMYVCMYMYNLIELNGNGNLYQSSIHYHLVIKRDVLEDGQFIDEIPERHLHL